MILGLGTDLVELARIETALGRHGEALLARLFTERERLLLAEDGAQRHRLVERVGVRFAAKEAALKALGTGWGRGLGWHEVEVLGGRGAPPTLSFSGNARTHMARLGASRAHVSLTHTTAHAAATVVLD